MTFKVNFSGFLHQATLLSSDSLKKLLSELPDINFYNVSSVQLEGSQGVSREAFLEFYESYIETLFSDGALDHALMSKMFSLAMATSEDCFYKQDLSLGRFLLKPCRSVIQMQPLALFVSSLDGLIHIKSFAKDAASFGLKFSFPTIYEQSGDHKIIELDPEDKEYAAFNVLRRFLRHHTRPVTVIGPQGKKTYSFRYSEDLKDKICKMSFLKRHGLEMIV